MTMVIFFSLIGVLVVGCIALAWILLKEAQKESRDSSKAKKIQAEFESLKKKNEELIEEAVSKEALYNELNKKYEVLKSQFEEEKAKQENIQPKQNQGPDKFSDTDLCKP